MRNPTQAADNAPHHGGHGAGPSADLLAQMSYETRDVSIIALAKWLGVFVVFIIGSMTVSFLVFKLTVLDPLRSERGRVVARVRQLPPFPQLQSDPKADMEDYRNAEDQVLTGAGSGSTKPGLSIDAAIDAEANQHGIAGIRGDATPWTYSNTAPKDDPSDKSYPGGGDYGSESGSSKPAPDGSTSVGEPVPAAVGKPTDVPDTSATTLPAAGSPAPTGNGTTP